MLNFNEAPYWEINPQSLEKFLKLQDGSPSSLATIDSLPMAFTEWDVDYKNRLLRGLLAFGSEAPSVWNSTGSEVAATPSTVEEGDSSGKRKASKTEEFGNLPKEILVARKPVLFAFKDWVKVFDKSAVKMNFKERAKEYRTMAVKNENDRKAIWVALMTAVKEKKAGKESEEPAEKKQKVKTGAATNADDFLSSF
jgi:hypothetical protein